MEYFGMVILKDGRKCLLRNGTEADGPAVLERVMLTHTQTDWLMTYPDEFKMSSEDEARFLSEKADSANEVELLAEVGGKVVGQAGIDCAGSCDKIRHRAHFGISVDQAYWGLGIGRALTRACVECAKRAGYAQVELSVAADNARAIDLYRSEGFVEFGRNPRGFRSRLTGWQELVFMRMELNGGQPEPEPAEEIARASGNEKQEDIRP